MAFPVDSNDWGQLYNDRITVTVQRSEEVLNLQNKILWFSQTDTRTEAEGYSDAET